MKKCTSEAESSAVPGKKSHRDNGTALVSLLFPHHPCADSPFLYEVLSSELFPYHQGPHPSCRVSLSNHAAFSVDLFPNCVHHLVMCVLVLP